MRIAIISFGHIDSITELSLALAKAGHDVSLYLEVYTDRFVSSTVDFDLKNMPYGISGIEKLRGTSAETDRYLDFIKDKITCNLVRLPSNRLKDLQNIRYLLKLRRDVQKVKPDVIHFNGSTILQIILYFLFYFKPKVYTIHDFVQHGGQESRRNDVINKLHTRMRYVFIQHSEYLKSLMIGKSGIEESRVKVVYYAPFDFYSLYQRPEIHEEFPSAIFFGRILPYKGLQYFCEAIEIVAKKHPQAKFYILGMSFIDYDLSELVAKYNVVHIDRHISNSELSEYLQKASVTVVPYLDATQSGVIVTSYAFNKPVISTNVGGLPEIVIENQTGMLVPPKDSNQLAEKMNYLFENRDVLLAMQKNIEEMRSDVSSHMLNWDVIARDTVGVYDYAIKLYG